MMASIFMKEKNYLRRTLSLTIQFVYFLPLTFLFFVNFAVFDTDAWIHRSMCSSYANFSYIKDDAVLQGSVYWTFRNKTQEECEAECVNEFHCRSVNTEKDGDRICELNMENVLEKIKNLQLTPKIGWVHKATDYNDPWVGKVCKALKPCPVNHVCVDSCSCPGYRCIKCRGMKIGVSCLATLVIEGMPLGMENRQITDYQITVSSFNQNDPPSEARLNSKSRWCVNPYSYGGDHFIKIRFHSRKIVTDIAVQGHTDHGNWVKTYEMMYTEDRTTWQKYEEDGVIRIFKGPQSGDLIAKESLVYYIQAYEIKLLPKAWHGWLCMRIELYGIEDPWQPSLPKVITGHPLGMEKETIANYQISSSSYNHYSNRAHHARLNLDGGWCAKNTDVFQYIRVDFPSRMIITEIAVQGFGLPTTRRWVTSYQLSYTEDSYAWKMYEVDGEVKTFTGTSSQQAAVKKSLSYWIRVLAIKLNPRSWNFMICMRMELYGIRDPYQPMIPTGCSNNARPLGMASNEIPDSSVTASASYSNSYTPQRGRLNAYSDWCEKNGADRINSFIQVDIGKKMVVVAIATQGRFVEPHWVKSYNVGYSNTNQNFAWISSGNTNVTFSGNTNNYEIVKNKLNPPIKARYVRIAPTDYEYLMCMRIELYGCDIL